MSSKTASLKNRRVDVLIAFTRAKHRSDRSTCHSEERSDEESPPKKVNLGMWGILRYAQSDKITEHIFGKRTLGPFFPTHWEKNNKAPCESL